MSSPSIASNASNPLKPLICSIRSSSLATIAAPRLSSPISILTAGPITWAMDLWPWLYSTVLLKAQSLSRSREDPIEHGKLKPVSLLQRIKARLNSTELRFGCGHTLPRRIPSLNHIGGPVYSDKLAQFLAATVKELVRELTEVEYRSLQAHQVRGFSGHWMIFSFL